ncbi:hypothetical protein FEQ05_04651 [Burkholderia pseudomultivorans]|uniref:SH3 domain-containing protein n=2 Tax=Burkholderia pseudomultivorans TaxID=1207504 RepID=A0ABU2EC06_9BURK|nr:hypothetical protein [Burkholderia pseudomultivorans]MDR8738647.1 hypothetical protein [Burkholderia pseudomultivorans]MDR8745152.1 hypothetical protein [Burkholderia pseudomultivorans]MDR8757186.1 hypothetical protein [Burkholderia pseudomultivorans]MDR8781520.1 hypothetical protein [Burkholderia pseudomultivorans]
MFSKPSMPPRPTFRPRASLCAPLLACCASLAPAHAAEPLLAFKVDDKVTARVERADSKHITVRFLPGGTTQTLDVTVTDEDGHYQLETDDYNFDGHQDLAIRALLGMVNASYGVYLYDAARRRFEPLRMPAGNMPQGNCGDLVNLDAKPKERTLYSSCRGGPMWTTDAYRFDGNGRLYLYQASETIPDDVVTLLGVDETAGQGPPSMRITYDAHGRRIARRPDAYGGGTVTFKVRAARVPLHDAASDAPTRRYVVAGDTLELVDASADFRWLKVVYRNPHAGAVTGWIDVKEATGG